MSPITTLIASLICVIMGIFAFLRNNWVFSVRMKLIGNPRKPEYLSYDMMMLKFWIWNIEKLKRK